MHFFMPSRPGENPGSEGGVAAGVTTAVSLVVHEFRMMATVVKQQKLSLYANVDLNDGDAEGARQYAYLLLDPS